MINDFTGGGQIFLHKVRMFFQVFGRSFKAALLASIIIVGLISYKQINVFDLKAAMTYQKAIFANYIDTVTRIFRQSSITSLDCYYTKIDAYDRKGLHTKDASPLKILKSNWFKKNYFEVLDFIKIRLMIAAGLTATLFVIIYIIWSKFGKAAKAKKHLSGHTIKNAHQVAHYLKTRKLASHFELAGLPLVKNTETKHILITGSTGSGKTNCLHTFLPQIREQKQPAIVIDTEGEMIARYYRPGHDIILNPFDSRSHNWDLWDEIDSNRNLQRIADSFFPAPPPDARNSDNKWDEWGKMLFVGVLEYLRSKGTPTTEELYNLIHKEPIEQLIKKLESTSVGTLLGAGGSNSNNAAPHNIRINTLLATKWLEFINDTKNKSFSFKRWFSTLDQYKEDRWVFIACDGGDAKILLPFISTLADIAIGSLISLGVKEDRRVWFIFDELAKLKYLPALQESITILRKYGGCVLAATQSFNQIFAFYGKNSGGAMLSQFNTNIIFRISEVEEAKIIVKRIGEIEYLSHQKNTSYGAHEMRDGISYTEQEKKQDLVKVNDLSNLKPNQAFILLPEPDVAISNVSFELVEKPKSLQIPFLNNTAVESMTQDRNARWNERLS
jgi:type IV conjugative transfer system coupling protein TraD